MIVKKPRQYTPKQREAKQLWQRQYRKNIRETRKALGQCVECGEINDRQGRCLCTNCSGKSKVRRDNVWYKKDKLGLCRFCDNPAQPNRTSCRDCVVKKHKYHKSTNWTPRFKKYQDLYVKQKGLCTGCGGFYPFAQICVDHIIPKDKGGSESMSNKQLLCSACNGCKMTGTMEDLALRRRERGYDANTIGWPNPPEIQNRISQPSTTGETQCQNN